MFKKLLAAVGLGAASSGAAVATVTAGNGLHHPYTQEHVNFMYNLLFCDDPALFANRDGNQESGAWAVLTAQPPELAALMTIAQDEKQEGRIRALAYNRLRASGGASPSKDLLGVIVEVPLEGGLDVLAAFSDGGVRYLNQSGKILVIEGDDTPIAGMAMELLSIARPVIDKIGPWEEARLPAPRLGNIRITFLVSDGLYFGEGPAPALQNDAMAGPVLSKATELLQKAVALGTK
jgi:hypothetical protein